jgi:hypothetical protein
VLFPGGRYETPRLSPAHHYRPAACHDTTQPEKANPTSLAPISSFQVVALGTPDIIVNTTADVTDFGGAQQALTPRYDHLQSRFERATRGRRPAETLWNKPWNSTQSNTKPVVQY